MAGPGDTPSKAANGPNSPGDKPSDKGKGKAIDAEEKKEPQLDKDGKPVEDEKVLPPGMRTVRPQAHGHFTDICDFRGAQRGRPKA